MSKTDDLVSEDWWKSEESRIITAKLAKIISIYTNKSDYSVKRLHFFLKNLIWKTDLEIEHFLLKNEEKVADIIENCTSKDMDIISHLFLILTVLLNSHFHKKNLLKCFQE